MNRIRIDKRPCRHSRVTLAKRSFPSCSRTRTVCRSDHSGNFNSGAGWRQQERPAENLQGLPQTKSRGIDRVKFDEFVLATQVESIISMMSYMPSPTSRAPGQGAMKVAQQDSKACHPQLRARVRRDRSDCCLDNEWTHHNHGRFAERALIAYSIKSKMSTGLPLYVPSCRFLNPHVWATWMDAW